MFPETGIGEEIHRQFYSELFFNFHLVMKKLSREKTIFMPRLHTGLVAMLTYSSAPAHHASVRMARGQVTLISARNLSTLFFSAAGVLGHSAGSLSYSMDQSYGHRDT